MKDREERAPRSRASETPSPSKRAVAKGTSEEFVDAFADALRDILQDERPRAA
jgi:hypothetical protein